MESVQVRKNLPKLFHQGLWLCSLIGVTACSHWDFHRESPGRFTSQAARVKNEAPLGLALPPPNSNQVNETYMGTKADYHFTLAESYALQGEASKAVENYKLALIYDQKSPQIRYRLALEYVKLGLVTEAIAQCQEALKSSPQHRDSALLLGGLLSAMGLYDQALDLYGKLLKAHPHDENILLFMGSVYAEKGDFSKAIAHFKKMVRNPKLKDKSQAWYFLGRVYSSKPRPELENAISSYVTSLKLDPESLDVVLALGKIYQALREKQKAKRLYSDYQNEHGNHHLVAERLAKIHLEDEEFEKALVQLRWVEAHDPRNLNVSLKVALLMIEQKQYQGAITKLKAILKKSPDSEKVRFYLGALYEEVKNYGAAIEQFDKVQFGSPFYEEAVLHSAYLHQLMGSVEGAITRVKEGLRHQKGQVKLWVLHASLLTEAQQTKEAQKVLQSALQLFPKETQIHFQLGSLYDNMGEKHKTIEQMEKVLGLDENHIQALNYLAYLYAQEATNLKKAEQLVRKALKLKPGDGFIMDTLGWVLFKQDRIEEAVKTLEKAHRKESQEPIIAEHLGDAYFRHQLHGKAKEMYRKAVRLEKNKAKRTKIQMKISSMEQGIQAERARRSSQRTRRPASN